MRGILGALSFVTVLAAAPLPGFCQDVMGYRLGMTEGEVSKRASDQGHTIKPHGAGYNIVASGLSLWITFCKEAETVGAVSYTVSGGFTKFVAKLEDIRRDFGGTAFVNWRQFVGYRGEEHSNLEVAFVREDRPYTVSVTLFGTKKYDTTNYQVTYEATPVCPYAAPTGSP